MRFRPSIVPGLLLGLASLASLAVVPTTIASSTEDADNLYNKIMRQPYWRREDTLRELDIPTRSLVLVSRINNYRETHDFNQTQHEFLDKVIEEIKDADHVSPQLHREAERYFESGTFNRLTTTVLDVDNESPPPHVPPPRPPPHHVRQEGGDVWLSNPRMWPLG